LHRDLVKKFEGKRTLRDPGFDGRIILMWGNLLRLAHGFGEEI